MTESDVMLGGSSLTRQKIVESVEFDKLSDELLIEILIRLPLRPLKLCKCVSRRFRSLISGSYFIRCYVNCHQGSNSFALYCQSDHMFHDIIHHSLIGIDIGFHLRFFPCSKQTLTYLASNNGLVLCSEAWSCQIVYFVCNPLTKQWVVLPPPPSIMKPDYVGFICKTQYEDDHGEADESEMGSKTSFKVVQFEAKLSSTLKLEIFCSVLGRWTEKYFMLNSTSDYELFYGSNHTMRLRCAVVCDGLLHWNAISNRGIFIYDPYNGDCRTIKFPYVGRGQKFWVYSLGECCGRLRYAIFSLDNKNYRAWELKDYSNGGDWLLLHNVHLDEMKSMVQTINKNSLCLLFLHPLNQDIVFFWCFDSDQIVEYNMGNKLLQLPCFLPHDKIKGICGPIMYPFVLPCWPTAVPQIQLHDLTP